MPYSAAFSTVLPTQTTLRCRGSERTRCRSIRTTATDKDDLFVKDLACILRVLKLAVRCDMAATHTEDRDRKARHVLLFDVVQVDAADQRARRW